MVHLPEYMCRTRLSGWSGCSALLLLPQAAVPQSFFGEGGSSDDVAILLWPHATSSTLLRVICYSSTPYYLLTPLDITYRTNIWVISNHVLMDRTAICNEGVWVSGVPPLYPLAPLLISSSSLMVKVIQNTTRTVTLVLILVLLCGQPLWPEKFFIWRLARTCNFLYISILASPLSGCRFFSWV